MKLFLAKAWLLATALAVFGCVTYEDWRVFLCAMGVGLLAVSVVTAFQILVEGSTK